MSSAFRLRSVEKKYPGFTLRVPALELASGTLLGVIGPNGAGKSTLLRMLLGLVRPDAGRIEVLGHAYPAGEAEARDEIGFLSDDLRLYGGVTLDWHVRFVRSVCPRWDEALAAELARRLDIDRSRPIKNFSHGQRVKAALLLALARRPRLLVLDEPTTALDPAVRREVLAELLQVLAEEERTVIFSSHLTQDVERISDRVLFLTGGRIVLEEDTPDLLARFRRVHLRAAEEFTIPTGFSAETGSPGGRMRILVCKEWSDAAAARLVAGGAEVVEVQPLSLEEIYLLCAGAPSATGAVPAASVSEVRL